MSIEVRQVSGKAGLHEFIRFPFSLYKGSEYWIPPLDKNEMKTLSPELNPAHASAPAALFIAYNDNKAVGRIAAIACKGRNGVEGRFGWYDVIDDVEVSRSLFAQAEQWLRSKGSLQVKGPMGFTNLDRAGMLTFGYDELPTIATLYNYPYYNDHVESLGYQKAIDYVEYEFGVPEIPEKVTSLMDVIAKRYGLRVLDNLSTKAMLPYGHQLFDLINETHRKLYGFVLLSEEMKEYYINRYIPYIRGDFVVMIVNEENKLVAYALTMPSYSRAFQKAQGRLFPFGFWHILRASKNVRRADLLLIGVADALRNKGVTALIFHRVITMYKKLGIQVVESNPELEDNQQVQALWNKYEYRQHKRRRVYQKDL
jgi:hypothetical protein